MQREYGELVAAYLKELRAEADIVIEMARALSQATTQRRQIRQDLEQSLNDVRISAAQAASSGYRAAEIRQSRDVATSSQIPPALPANVQHQPAYDHYQTAPVQNITGPWAPPHETRLSPQNGANESIDSIFADLQRAFDSVQAPIATQSHYQHGYFNGFLRQ